MYNFGKIIIPTVFFLGVVSCSDNVNSTESTVNSQTENNAAETSQTTSADSEYVSPLPDDAPIFTVAIEKDDYPPFEYRNEYGVYIGYDIDLIRAVGEEAGFKVQMDFLPFSDILPSLDAGVNDIAISALTVSAERALNFDSSLPYIKSASNFIVKEGSEYQTDDQLIGKNIAVQAGGFQEKELTSHDDSYNIKPVKTNFLAFKSLVMHESEALYADKTMLMYLAEQFPEQKVHYISHGEQTNISIFTKKGNKEVMVKINEGLKAIKSNGRYQEINKKWFGSNANAVAVE